MKRLLLTLALTCVLCGGALAADMPTCGAPSPTQTEDSTNPGDVPSTGEPGEMPGVGLLLTILDWAF